MTTSRSAPNTSSRLELLEYHRGHIAGSVVLLGGSNGDAAPEKNAESGAGAGATASEGHGHGHGPGRGGARRGWGLLSVLRAAFLPEGFPESVSPDYLSFQAWDTVQALSSYVRGMLTSAAILRGVGVGQQVGAPAAAAGQGGGRAAEGRRRGGGGAAEGRRRGGGGAGEGRGRGGGEAGEGRGRGGGGAAEGRGRGGGGAAEGRRGGGGGAAEGRRRGGGGAAEGAAEGRRRGGGGAAEGRRRGRRRGGGGAAEGRRRGGGGAAEGAAEASTPLAAVFTFFLRDLAGMAGGVLFAYAEGSSFDACAKQWRLFADITNDLGMTVELASPLLPRALFLPCACFGSIARSVTGVAGGATRAALTQHFARRGNAADVSAKEQSQETATTIVGMVLGMAVTRLLATDPHDPAGTTIGGSSSSSSSRAVWAVLAAWLVFGLLTALHVWANVRAMRCLVLRSLNQPRLELLVTRYLGQDGGSSAGDAAGGGGGSGGAAAGRVLSPLQVSALEDLTPPPFRRLWDWAAGAARRRPVQLHFGCRLAAAAAAAAAAASSAGAGGGRGRGGSGSGGGGAEGAQEQEQPQSRLRQAVARASRRPYLLLASASGSTTHGGGGGSGTTLLPPAASPPRGGRTHVHVHVVLHRRATAAAALLDAAAADAAGAGAGAGARARADGLLRAFVHAHCLAHQLRLLQHAQAAQAARREHTAGAAPAATASAAANTVAAAEAAADEWMATRYEPFLCALAAAGWHTDRVTLPRPAWTAEWGPAVGPAEAAREGSRGRGAHED
ncbi:hypothetical protein HYH02_003813 [Chlamydomonas schloesseri]|uniref:Uncharacterized protein n=1 Tax=Chlamydomonas schloesseri TaxID=2026947 RepID=A0A836B8V6_9CHLO|nr:hypothetical protein HYH02_003813 [Chlamydomonas schloesseri]|eukprot:KAG2451206.1 hypothetical protein HYH02_003813 [Chlamydomonas schloesseri]